MMWLGYVLLMAAFGVAFYVIYSGDEKKGISLANTGLGIKRIDKSAFLLKGFAPYNKLLFKTILKPYEPDLKNKLAIVRWNIKPEEFFSAKELAAIFLPLAFFMVAGAKIIPLLVFFAFIGFMIPDFVLNGKVREAKEKIARCMPEVVDLLSLCVGAGLNFISAMRWVVEKSKPNPLTEQFQTVLEEINMGKPRSEALRNMSKKLGLADITSFSRILIQADKLGTPVEEAFKIISDDTRMRRFHRGERQAMRAPMKMLIPLIFLILPTIMIIIAGPIILRFMKGGMFS